MEENICRKLLSTQKRTGTAIRYKKDGTWRDVSWKEYYLTVETIACALASIGIKKGDCVSILSNTRPEWSYADMAILGLGAITVPIYPSNTFEEIEYIINHSGSTFLIAEDDSQLKKWAKISGKCPQVLGVALISGPSPSGSNSFSWDELLKKGAEKKKAEPDFFTKCCEAVDFDQIATIPYTSGTTGQPKGVVLSHRQITSEVKDVYSELGMGSDDMTLTFLPYSHVLGRVEHLGSVHAGFTLAFAESIEKIKSNLHEVKPTVIVGVPRIFEKIYNGVISQAEINPTKNKIFSWALGVGKKVSSHQRNHEAIPLILIPQYLLAKKLVFDKLKDGLGGRLRFAVSGGAPLSSTIAEFFHAAGILLLEGYGLTETTAAITLNVPHDFEFGTVGKPLGDVQIKIADDGEILIKSDKIMVEYYKNQEATKEIFHDGWFATGDIGELNSKGHLRITDRKKDLIKTAGGKYIAPQKLENLLKLNKFISNVLIHGDQRKYVVALVTLNPDELNRFAKSRGISGKAPSELSQNSDIKATIRDVIADVNSQLANYESIKSFEVLPEDFTIESGELTPSLKVKRKYCDKKYAAIIDGLYGVDRSGL